MKRSRMFRLVMACTFVVASTIFANLLMAQGGDPPTDVRYRIHWITGPADTTVWQLNDLVVTTDVNGIPTNALVVGSYYRENQPISGFVYDVFGTIDPDLTRADPNPGIPDEPIPDRFWDIEDLAEAPQGWGSLAKSSLRGANSAGLIAGYVEDENGVEHAVYLNLGNPDAAPYQLVLLPRPDAHIGDECRGRDVTESGDILVQYLDPSDGDWRGYVYTNSGPEDIAWQGTPIVFSGEGSMFLNSLRHVVGKRADGMVIRYSMPTENSEESYEEFPNLHWAQEVNDNGQFAATATNIRGRHRYATRVEEDGSIGWTAAERGTWGDRINNEGDLLFEYMGMSERFYYHEDLQESFNLRDLVIAESDPDFWFRDQDNWGWIRLSDRDSTGFGWVAKALRVTDSYGLQTWKLALLIPEIVTPPTTVTLTADDPSFPLNIPDYPQDGVESTMQVADHYVIDNLIVWMNIDHSRPSDLRASLTGPDGQTTVMLPNISGDNPVAVFNTSSTAGDWTLHVWDTKKKKTGTLDGWSITVTYSD